MYYTKIQFNRFSHNIYQALCGVAVVLMLSMLFSLPASSSMLLQKTSAPHGPTLQPQLLEMATQNPDQILSVIVQKSSQGASVDAAILSLGGKITHNLSIINALSVEIPANRISQLGATDGIKWVSLDATVNKSSYNGCVVCLNPNTSNNYSTFDNATSVWNNSTATSSWLQGNGVGVAVIDSGVNQLNDFQDSGNNSRIIAKVKLNSNTNSMSDQYGHGTLVAGVVAGRGQLSAGANVGIAPGANLINVKVSDDIGSASTSDLVTGLQWVLYNKSNYNIRVVNISMNSSIAQSYNVDPIDAAAEVLWFNGIVVVASAGNNGTANLFAPANDPFVITVGSIYDTSLTSTPNMVVAPFSAYGTDETGNIKPDLVTPGVNIVSDLASNGDTLAALHPLNVLNSNYMRVSGTSFSAPQVAGAVALLLQSEPNLNPDQVKYRLKATAVQNVKRGSWDTRSTWSNYNATTSGAGYLDIYALVTQTQITATANTGLAASQMLWTGSTPVNWSSVNWSSVNWSSVNWSSVNWSSVNWSSVNWSSDYWGI